MNTQLVHVSNNRLVTTSLLIAQNFGKKHKDVLRAIQQLDCSKEFGERNFTPTTYISNQNKELPMYEISRDGFTFLCMGFICIFNRCKIALVLGGLKDFKAGFKAKIVLLFSAIFNEVKGKDEQAKQNGTREVRRKTGYQIRFV